MKPSECKQCKHGGYVIPGVNKLQPLFKTECHDRAKEIDPDNIQDWYSLNLGWAIGKGLTPEHAALFALHIRYHTDLG